MKKLIYILYILVSAGLFCSQYCADVSAAQDSSPETRHSFRLAYKNTGFWYSVTIPFEGREIAFKKEPDFGEHDVARGLIPTGKDEKTHICFAWDTTDGVMYIDENGNLDLTDDPSGVFTREESKYSFPQRFNNIPIEFQQDSVRHHYTIDISFYGWGGRPQGYINVRSGWQGDIELHGRTWTLAVVDNMDGVIKEEDAFYLYPLREDDREHGDRSHINMLSIVPELFFDGHGYDISYDIVSGETESVMEATFTETHPELAELTIDGEYITRLTFSDGNNTRAPSVILESPGTKVMIPAGTYESRRVIVDSGDSLGIYFADVVKKLTIAGGDAATLKAGAPLINSVNTSPEGRYIRLAFQLTGNDGGKYNQLYTNYQKAPKYAIYHDDTMIASGSFEYG